MLNYPHFNPIALSIWRLKIHWYGIMYLIGFAVAWWLARRRASKPNSSWTAVDVDDLIFFAMLGVILGGRIGYVLFYGEAMWRADWLYPLKIWDGGMSFHGGLLGVMTAALIFAWRRHRNAIDVADFLAPLPGIGLCAGRLGNFINGELWGRVTTSQWGMRITPGLNGSASEVRFPSQLYESALEGLVLFSVIWWFTSKPRPRFAASGLFLCVYALVRIAIEFVREPDAQLGYLALDWVTMGQLLSLPMLAAGLLALYIAATRRTPSGNYKAAA
jgi:phosphatidylglycerol:prolipoprotein diacylglycerol transferase